MVADTIQTQTVVLSRSAHRRSGLAALHPETLSSHSQECRCISDAGKHTLWISEEEELTSDLLQCGAKPDHSLGDALLFYMPKAASIPALTTYFRHLVFGSEGSFLPDEELAEVLINEQRADYIIGGLVDHSSKNITLWRGSLEPLVVPFEAFAPSGDGVAPDFEQFQVIEYGLTVRLGPYEATTESLLYEFDPAYRRRIAKERRASDQSFGASLRRLRKQRGLRREDFAPLSAKTIARIEQGEELPERLHNRTWQILSQKLGVEPEEIETF
jgi:hypothetical protein